MDRKRVGKPRARAFKSQATYMQILWWPYALLAVMADTVQVNMLLPLHHAPSVLRPLTPMSIGQFASTKIPTITLSVYIFLQAVMNTLMIVVGSRRAQRLVDQRKRLRLLLDPEAREDSVEIQELELQVSKLRAQHTNDNSRNGSLDLNVSRKQDVELETLRSRSAEEEDDLLTRIQGMRKQLDSSSSQHRNAEISLKVRIAELEEQLAQAKELRDMDAQRFDELQSNHAAHMDHSSKARKNSVELQDRVDSLSKELHTTRTEHSTETHSLTQRALSLQHKVDELVGELANTRTDQDTQKGLHARLATELHARIQELEALAEDANGSVEKHVASLQVTKSRVVETEQRIQELEGQLQTQHGEVATLKDSLADAEKERQRLHGLLDNATIEVNNLYQRVEAFKEEASTFEKRLAKAEEEKTAASTLAQDKESEVIALQNRLTTAATDSLAAEVKYSDLQAERKTVEEELTVVQEQKTALEAQIKAKDEEIASLIKAQAASPLPARMAKSPLAPAGHSRSFSASSVTTSPSTPARSPSSLGKRQGGKPSEDKTPNGTPSRSNTRQRLSSFLGLP